MIEPARINADKRQLKKFETALAEAVQKVRNFLYRDKRCGRNCLSYAAQLSALNGRKGSPTFHESSNISFNISYLGYY